MPRASAQSRRGDAPVSGRDPALFQMQEGDRVNIGRPFETSLAVGRSTGRHERAPVVRELCGNAFEKTPVTTERRARGCASFCGFYRQESVAVGAWRGLITQWPPVDPRLKNWLLVTLCERRGSRPLSARTSFRDRTPCAEPARA